MFTLRNGVINNRIANNVAMTSLQKLCYKLGREMKPISFGDLSGDGSVVDILSVRNKDKIPLWYALVDYYSNDLGIDIDINDVTAIKSVVTDYLLRSSLCYVEVVKAEEESKKTYKDSKYKAVSAKFLTSKNALIVANIEGVTPIMCANKYEANFAIDYEDIELGEIPYLKLSVFNPQKKVIKCNKNLNVFTCRVVSIPLISEWLKGISEIMNNNLVEFTYYKDDDTERKIVTTLNYNMLLNYYSEDRVRDMIKNSVNGEDFGEPSYIPLQGNVERGWFRVPEVGSSIIDDCGTRAINFARITSVKIVDKVDTSFINVSLNNVIEVFTKKLDYLSTTNKNSIIAKIYHELWNSGYGEDLKYPIQAYKTTQEIVGAIRNFVSSKQYTGTPFKRSLHMFMVTNPDIFPDYIGQKIEPIKIGNNYGVADFTFD